MIKIYVAEYFFSLTVIKMYVAELFRFITLINYVVEFHNSDKIIMLIYIFLNLNRD